MALSCGMTALLIALGLQLEGMTDTNMNQVPIMREYWLLIGMLLVSGPLLKTASATHSVAADLGNNRKSEAGM